MFGGFFPWKPLCGHLQEREIYLCFVMCIELELVKTEIDIFLLYRLQKAKKNELHTEKRMDETCRQTPKGMS